MQESFQNNKNQRFQNKKNIVMSLIRERPQLEEQNPELINLRMKKNGSEVMKTKELRPRYLSFEPRQRENYDNAPERDDLDQFGDINQSSVDGNLNVFQNRNQDHTRLAGKELSILRKQRIENKMLGQLDEQEEEENLQCVEQNRQNGQNNQHMKNQKIKKVAKIVAVVGVVYGLAVMSKNGLQNTQRTNWKELKQKITSNGPKTKIMESLKSNAYSTAVSCGLKTGMNVLIEDKPTNESLKTNIKQCSRNFVGSFIGGQIGSNMPIVGSKIGRLAGSYLGSLVSTKVTKEAYAKGKQKAKIFVNNIKRKSRQMFSEE